MCSSSFVCTQLKGFKFREWLHISICPIDGTLSRPGSNGHEEVLHILITEGLTSGGFESYPR